MGWVPDSMWLSYVQVASPAPELRHDLAISTTAGTLPSARWAGFTAPAPSDGGFVWWPLLLLVGAPLVLVGGAAAVRRRAES
jgi:hypothetical protein